jgi:DNA invertase Pin-like site-specific DNA recombinase
LGSFLGGIAVKGHFYVAPNTVLACKNLKLRNEIFALILFRDYIAYVNCKSGMELKGNMSNLVGYARVSTRDQDYNGQIAELEAAGCTRIYREKESGARTDRRELAKAIAKLESGDVLVVSRLDRLARSTRDLLNVLAEITARGAGFKSLHDTWADTTTPHGRLMLTVLGGLAEFERELIRARTGAGRERAKARGVKFGRPSKLDEFQRREALARLAAGESQADVARSYRVNPATISRLAALL